MKYYDSVYLFLEEDKLIDNLTCNNITDLMYRDKICNLSYYEIKKISKKCLNKLKKFLIINLSNNKINKMYKFINPISNITELILNNNNISNTIYINDKYSNLKFLNLNYNKITNIYINLPNIENINLNNNNLISVNIITNNVLSIDLSFNKLKDINLIKSPKLYLLNLNNNFIESIKYIGYITYYNNNIIKKININNDDLVDLQLNNNLIELFEIKSYNLMSLELDNNNLYDCIIDCHNLVYLNAHSNNLSYINLIKCTNLMMINLYNNKLTNNFNIQKFCNQFNDLYQLNLLKNNISFEKNSIELEECCICLNEYLTFSIFIYCGHTICNNCYKDLNKCPICRAKKYNSLLLTFDNEL